MCVGTRPELDKNCMLDAIPELDTNCVWVQSQSWTQIVCGCNPRVGHKLCVGCNPSVGHNLCLGVMPLLDTNGVWKQSKMLSQIVIRLSLKHLVSDVEQS